MLDRILNLLGLRKGEQGDAYRRRIARATSPAKIVAGEPGDRVQGLDAVLSICAGKSVVDIGCHDGTVAVAFAEKGASFIDGVDLSPLAIEAARARLAEVDVDAHFETADLVEGMQPLRGQLRRSSYDILCYLGVHQHLRKQMSSVELAKFESQIFETANENIVIRTSERFMGDIDQRLRQAGFEPITDLLKGEIGPVRSYERKTTGR